jgi:uncharacterized protein YcbK (DUF882 family)
MMWIKATEWDQIQYFKPCEFDSPDAPGSGEQHMHLSFIDKLEQLRHYCGFPFIINSGYRTHAHNAEVGGVANSAHTRGYAADIRIHSSRERFRLVDNALIIGFRRMGVAKTFIHLDDDPSKPPEMLWLYG